MPMPITDGRRKALKAQGKLIRANLEIRHYNSFKDFFDDNSIGTFENYINIIRSTLRHSLVLLERNVDECFINQFHPWILGTMYLNMDIQLISDDYSCSVFMVEYVNKSNRGMGDLRRKLREISEKNPNADHITLIRKVAKKFLNSVEMSVQEVAWFELVDILDNKKYVQLYNEKQDLIMERRKLYEANINMDLIMTEIEAMCVLNDNENSIEEGNSQEREKTVFQNNDNNDDIDVTAHRVKTNIASIGKRDCVSAADYCEIMRTTNFKQRELVL